MRPSCAAFLSLLAACAPAQPAAQPASPPARCAWDARPADPPRGDGYRYRVAAGQGAVELCVEVDLPRGAPAQRRWAIEEVLRPFLRDVGVAGDGAFRAVPSG